MFSMSNLKQHILSALVTFVTVFAVTIAFAIQVPDFSFTKESLIAVSLAGITAGVRAVAKFITEWLATNFK